MLSEKIAELLKTTREERGFTVEDISRAISLRAEVIKNLESGDFEKAGAMVYTKSYLRKYAEFLGLDRQEFEEMLASLKSDDPLYRDVSDTFKLKNNLHERQHQSYLWIYIVILLLLLSGAVAFYYYDPLGIMPQQESSEMDDNIDAEENSGYEALRNDIESSALISSSKKNSREPSNLLTDDMSLEAGDVDEQNSGVNSLPLTLLTDEDYRENELYQENQQAEELISKQRDQEGFVESRNGNEESPSLDLKDIPKDTLIIAVKGECWVGIRDKSGKQIANEILNDGTYDFNGIPPYSITVGNARAVESIIINGNEIDEKIYRPTPNTTVKNFSIDPKEYEQNE